MAIALGAIRFIFPTLLMVVILTAFPELVPWLPNKLCDSNKACKFNKVNALAKIC